MATWSPRDHEEESWLRWERELRQGREKGEDPTCTQCGVVCTTPAAHRREENWLSPKAEGHRCATQLQVNTHLALESARTG